MHFKSWLLSEFDYYVVYRVDDHHHLPPYFFFYWFLIKFLLFIISVHVTIESMQEIQRSMRGY